jgi:hypothetical protein
MLMGWLKKSTRSLVGIAGVPVKIVTEHLPNQILNFAAALFRTFSESHGNNDFLIWRRVLRSVFFYVSEEIIFSIFKKQA